MSRSGVLAPYVDLHGAANNNRTIEAITLKCLAHTFDGSTMRTQRNPRLCGRPGQVFLGEPEGEDEDQAVSKVEPPIRYDHTVSQAENKELAIERFAELLQEAVKQVPIRKKTRVSKGAKLCRLEETKQHSMQKQERSKKVPVEE
jgi:hypothetical protein